MRVAAGVSASGESVVAWSFQPKEGKPREVWAAVAAAGAAFGAPAKLGALRNGAGSASPSAPAGTRWWRSRAATTWSWPSAVRAPASARPRASARRPTGSSSYPTVAVRADGGAVVAWQDALAGDVQAVIRAQPGPFSAPLTLAPKSGLRFPKSILALFDPLGGVDSGEVTSDSAAPTSDGGLPRALITPDGRAVVTDVGLAQRDGVWGASPRVRRSRSPAARRRSARGRGAARAGCVTPLITAEGHARARLGGQRRPRRDGRLHLAIEGALDGAEPPAPEVRVIAPKRRVLAADEDLRLAVRCSAACDVHVQLGGGLLAAGADVSLTRAGEKKVQLQRSVQAAGDASNGGPVACGCATARPVRAGRRRRR